MKFRPPLVPPIVLPCAPPKMWMPRPAFGERRGPGGVQADEVSGDDIVVGACAGDRQHVAIGCFRRSHSPQPAAAPPMVFAEAPLKISTPGNPLRDGGGARRIRPDVISHDAVVARPRAR